MGMCLIESAARVSKECHTSLPSTEGKRYSTRSAIVAFWSKIKLPG